MGHGIERSKVFHHVGTHRIKISLLRNNPLFEGVTPRVYVKKFGLQKYGKQRQEKYITSIYTNRF